MNLVERLRDMGWTDEIGHEAADAIERLQQERDEAQEKYDDMRIETMGTDLFIKDLQDQVKLLRDALEDEHWANPCDNGAQVKAFDKAAKALAATEPKP